MIKYRTVLLVDDDPIQTAVLTNYFLGIQAENIFVASDAVEALAILQHEKNAINLIVSDLQMPNMDGLEFMRHLKDIQFSGKLALISSLKHDLLDHAGRLANLHKLNFIGQISKPMTKDKLDTVFLAKTEGVISEQPANNIVISQDDFTAALENGDIIPFYQPKFDVQSGRIVGAEALARWKKAGTGNVSPEVFVKFAENNGRIEDLTCSLFKQVLTDTSRFLEHMSDQKIAVNLSAILMSNVALPDRLLSLMHSANIKPENISFEVTESSILDLDTSTLEVLSRLRISGFDVAIDDFGTGSSNIQTLRDFPYSELKIDRAFIQNAISNTFSAETVRASIALAREMDMIVVAEGIEDQEVLDFVRSKGIEQAQGFYLAKPMSADNYCKVLIHNAEIFANSTSKNAA